MSIVANDAVAAEADRLAEVPAALVDGPSSEAPVDSVAKRVFDVAGALLLLVVTLPLFVVVALSVRLTSRGPVLFTQDRVGAHGRTFRILKFRTMRIDAEARLAADEVLHRRYLENSYKLALDEDPRITPVGRFLRKSSLDELPQFWNVLVGSMSLVGPRPVLDEELLRYGDEQPLYLAARPGLTGSWQVSGRSTLDYPARVALDAEYVRTWSLAGDLVLLLRTPGAVVSCRGSF